MSGLGQPGQKLKLLDCVTHLRDECLIVHPKLSIDIDVRPKADIQLNNDLDLSRTLYNLINNAAHADNNASISISAHRQDRHVVVTVGDNGPGIPSSCLSNIFKRGYSTKGSTGLGLFQVKSDLEKFGATIEVESKELEGTTFKIEIPVYSK